MTTEVERTTKALFPLFVDLAGRWVLVVGGGPVATDKARELALHGARVRVVSPEVRPELEAIAEEIIWTDFAPHHVEGAFLVVAAAPPEVNRAARVAAEARGTFIVAVDDVASCTAYGAARLDRAGITVALSSNGTAPALVALLRRAIEAVLPEDLETWHSVATRARVEWKNLGTPIPVRRELLLEALNSLYPAGGRGT